VNFSAVLKDCIRFMQNLIPRIHKDLRIGCEGVYIYMAFILKTKARKKLGLLCPS